MERLKILMVIAVFHPYIGGSEKQAQRLASELIKKNVGVTVVTGRWSNLLRKYEELNGFKIIRNLTNLIFCSKGRLNTRVSFFHSDLLSSKAKLRSVKIFLRKIFVRISVYIYQISLFRFLLASRNSYDIIHVHQVLFPAFVSAVCARILKKPVIAKVGSSGFNSDINQIKKFPEGRLQLNYILKNITRLVCTSRKMEDEFLNEGINKDKIILIRNGIRIKDFYRSYESVKNLVFVGRFIKSKNINTLIAAFSKAIKITSKNLNLTLVGDGPEKVNIDNLIKKSGLEDNIILTGMVDNPAEFLKKSDIFIFPSIIEGLPNSLIEAMGYKLPCIASNIPGNVEVIGEDSPVYDIKEGDFKVTRYGVLFNPSDIRGLVNSIKYMVDNPKIRKEIGENAYNKIVSEYNIELIADKYIELYKEVLK